MASTDPYLNPLQEIVLDTGVLPCAVHGYDHLARDPFCEFCKKAIGDSECLYVAPNLRLYNNNGKIWNNGDICHNLLDFLCAANEA